LRNSWSESSCSSYDSVLEGEKILERAEWDADRLKFYDLLEKARYEVNALEACLKDRLKRLSDDSDDSRPSKKSRDEKEEAKDDDEEEGGEVYMVGPVVDGRIDVYYPLEMEQELLERGEIDEPAIELFEVEVPNEVSFTEEDEIEMYEDALAASTYHVHWADQVDTEKVGEEFALYATTVVDRRRMPRQRSQICK
jgi:hypothetical protein